MSNTIKSKEVLPCACGHNRWKTRGNSYTKPVSLYECRKCGQLREVSFEAEAK
jgi:hypothetical protein